MDSREQAVEIVVQPIIADDDRKKPWVAGVKRVVGEEWGITA